MHRVVVPIIVAALLAGCTMPKTRIYSLTLPPEQEVQRASGHAFLALRVDSPRYLAQPYIASRKSPYEIEISRYSKWDSPPREILLDALKGSLASTGLFREIRTSNAVPADFYSLKIDLKRFEAVDEGSASFGEVTFQIAFTSKNFIGSSGIYPSRSVFGWGSIRVKPSGSWMVIMHRIRP